MSLATALAVLLSSCGGGSSEASTRPAASNVVTAAEINRYPAGSVKRSFLNYWSDLQFQSWADVAAYYDPALRKFIGTPVLIGAKRLNASVYVLVKPEITRMKEEDDTTTIYFSVRLPDGTQELASTTWRKIQGNWEIVYDSRLDAELNQFARNRAEVQKNGSIATDSSQPPDPAVVQAGERAAQMQARFLELELHAEKP